MKQFDNKLDPSTAHLWVVDLGQRGYPGDRKSSIASFGGRTRAHSASDSSATAVPFFSLTVCFEEP